MRTFFYIDGFNFYYGCLKGSPHKWLDLQAFCQTLIDPSEAVTKIRYFTAPVKPPAHDPKQDQRQKIYLNALKTHIPQSLLEIHYGTFLKTQLFARLVKPIAGKKKALIHRTEEKGSDVSLAVHMVNDAWCDVYDRAVIVSNDSDLQDALKTIRTYHPNKKLWVASPQAEVSHVLRQYAHHVSTIRQHNLSRSQLPSPIPGTAYFKPQSWQSPPPRQAMKET